MRAARIVACVTVVGMIESAACSVVLVEPEAGGCNGAVALCSRRYDQVSYPTTHNSFAKLGDYLLANQDEDIPTQLADGVRGLMLDTYWYRDEVQLCHLDCDVGATPLAKVLGQVRSFLESSPREVITLILENYVTDTQLLQAFEAAGMMPLLYRPTGPSWPTLQEMIDANTRVVVFTEQGGGRLPWLLPLWDNVFETHCRAKSVETLDHCDVGRGSLSHGLFLFHHFTTVGTGSLLDAARANSNPFLLDRAIRCEGKLRRLPNFVAVDYYDHGDGLFLTVNQLNGL